jgi:hypothetical protein
MSWNFAETRASNDESEVYEGLESGAYYPRVMHKNWIIL